MQIAVEEGDAVLLVVKDFVVLEELEELEELDTELESELPELPELLVYKTLINIYHLISL